MRDLVVFGGSLIGGLAKLICKNLTIEPGVAEQKKFSNGETSIRVKDSVREKDVFIVQNGCGNVNDNFIELLIMISACKTASAKRVRAVLPFFPYLRQPENTKVTFSSEGSVSEEAGVQPKPMRPRLVLLNALAVHTVSEDDSGYKQWVAPNGTLIANLLTKAGADRCMTMDLHDPQFQGFFDISVDNLYSMPLFKRYIMDYIPQYKECVIVSPDSGGAKRAIAIADALGLSFALIHRERRVKVTPAACDSPLLSTSVSMSSSISTTTRVNKPMLVGDVKDKVCVLVDDLADTGGTLTRAARLLKETGALYVYCLVTHAIFSGDAVDRLRLSDIDKIITTNSIPQTQHVSQLGSDRFEVLDVLRIFAEAIRRIHNGESVSMLFDHGW